MAELFDMGKYALFIWPSYGLSVFVLIALTLWSVRAKREAMATHKRLEAQLHPDQTK